MNRKTLIALALVLLAAIALLVYFASNTPDKDKTAPTTPQPPPPATASASAATPAANNNPQGAQAAQNKDPLVPLKTALPKPKHEGTPVAIKVPNYETAADLAARPPVMIPEGSTNLALHKPVTSSDTMPLVGELSQVTDGDKNSSDGDFVELSDGKQWIQIDLQNEHRIHAIALWHYHAQERAYHDVIIQISNDPDFQKNVTTVFNNDHDNSYGLGAGKDKAYPETNKGRVIPVNAVAGRYVRLHSRGNNVNSANHYIEVEVWGK